MLRSSRVALITDDDRQANNLKELLEKHILLVRAGNLKELHKLLRGTHFDAIFCEWSYANGRWREVIESVRLSFPRIPVIVLSRTGGEREWIEVLAAGAFDLLVPPFSERLVVSVLEDASLFQKAAPLRLAREKAVAKAS